MIFVGFELLFWFLLHFLRLTFLALRENATRACARQDDWKVMKVTDRDAYARRGRPKIGKVYSRGSTGSRAIREAGTRLLPFSPPRSPGGGLLPTSHT
eukprot:scaffold1540_cov181-Pinguiococcus_pyrenoidosus.AAC.2